MPENNLELLLIQAEQEHSSAGNQKQEKWTYTDIICYWSSKTGQSEKSVSAPPISVVF